MNLLAPVSRRYEHVLMLSEQLVIWGVARRQCLKAYFVQLAVLANHQNGRDTHIRQIKIFGPRMHSMHALGHPVGFTTDEFSTYGTLR